MFKLNLTREAEETQFGESDNMPTEHVQQRSEEGKRISGWRLKLDSPGSWQGPRMALLKSRQQLKNRLQTCDVWKREVRGQRHRGRKVQLQRETGTSPIWLTHKNLNQPHDCICLKKNSYPMPLTRVRKLMDELVSSCRILKGKKKSLTMT